MNRFLAEAEAAERIGVLGGVSKFTLPGLEASRTHCETGDVQIDRID